MEITKFWLWWIMNCSYDEMKQGCMTVAGADDMLGEHIWGKLLDMLNDGGRYKAAVEFFFYLDSETRQEFFDKVVLPKYQK